MIQILGKKSAAKRQFVYTLATLLAIHYGKYEVYSESFSRISEDYVDSLSIHPLTNYCGEERCIIEAENLNLSAQNTICFLTPYHPEIKSFLRYLETEQPKQILVVYADHIKESVLNKQYLARLIAERSETTKVEIITVEWDKLNKLISNEGLFDGYYQISSLSREYKNALAYVLEVTNGITYRESKKYFRRERRGLR
ncbi:hypothetical protein EII17_07205 [Clostridiales bacterium COT073_COT-073]|nr:hypothetical protein EII17_07205 [Clostridiales bacterium COT073_COT-073]